MPDYRNRKVYISFHQLKTSISPSSFQYSSEILKNFELSFFQKDGSIIQSYAELQTYNMWTFWRKARAIWFHQNFLHPGQPVIHPYLVVHNPNVLYPFGKSANSFLTLSGSIKVPRRSKISSALVRYSRA